MGNKHYLLLILIAACFSLPVSLSFNAAAEDIIRPPAVAGSFYPDSESELRAMITEYLNNTPDEKPAGDIFAAMAPHAGYVYSGAVAAHTFKQLAKIDFDTIVIIGHDFYADAVAFLSPADYFQTPLGLVQVDREMVGKMLKFNKGIKSDKSIHSEDHSVEIQLPFLQVLGKKCKIVPVMFGNPTVKNCRILADAIIAAAGDKKVFVLSSTDMSHYPSYEDDRKVDTATLEIVKSMDVDKLFSYLDAQVKSRAVSNLQTAMCSRGGVGTAIFFAKARGASQAHVLRYANSGDVPIGSRDRVVGYSSVLFVNTSPAEFK
jgi:AmmeMemoRadiSam system protein B